MNTNQIPIPADLQEQLARFALIVLNLTKDKYEGDFYFTVAANEISDAAVKNRLAFVNKYGNFELNEIVRKLVRLANDQPEPVPFYPPMSAPVGQIFAGQIAGEGKDGIYPLLRATDDCLLQIGRNGGVVNTWSIKALRYWTYLANLQTLQPNQTEETGNE